MPAPTALVRSKRTILSGVAKVYFLPVVAGAIPTRTEIDAGTDLTGGISDLSGWMTKGSTVDAPDLGTAITGKISGRVSLDDSSITFYGSKDTQDVRSVFPRGTSGYIVMADGGDVATQKADLFKVTTTALGKTRSTGNDAYKLTVDYAIEQTTEDFALPATV